MDTTKEPHIPVDVLKTSLKWNFLKLKQKNSGCLGIWDSTNSEILATTVMKVILIK